MAKTIKTLFGVVEVQEDFSTADEKLATDHKCPKCGYEWSGRKRSDGESPRGSLFEEKVARAEYACPKCRHEWSGGIRSASSFGERRRRVVVRERSEKPPYRVPLMSEVAKVPWNGFNAVSTFSGCGGSSLGYKMAGFRVLWANEFVPAAQDVYRKNHPKTILDVRDIRQVKPEEILKAIGLKKGELDLFDGSPPCASFSTAGKRERGWGEVKKYSDVKQRTDDLFFEYVRLLKGLRPKVFVAENVSGLVKGSAKGYFKLILRALKECGYRVGVKVLDAQNLGVPQMRSRTIFVGVREDLGIDPAHPSPLPWSYSVRDAIPWIADLGTSKKSPRAFKSDLDLGRSAPTVLTSRTKGAYFNHYVEEVVGVRKAKASSEEDWQSSSDGPAPTITATLPGKNRARMSGGFVEVRKVSVALEQRKVFGRRLTSSVDGPCPTILTNGAANDADRVVRKVEPESALCNAVGGEWDKLSPGEQSEKYFSLCKPSLDKPSPTVTAVGGTPAASVAHPLERRKFSIEELKRICAFPDDFVLTGSYAQQWERLGRAVPPLMMKAIAETVRDEILIPARKKHR